MLDKGFTGAPFGFQATRFSTAGVHPKNLVPGTFLTHGNTASTDNDIGPGKYSPKYGWCSAKEVPKNATGSGWKRQYELSHMIPLPCLLNKKEWKKRINLPRKLGPGTYNPQDIYVKKDASIRGLLDLKEPRFNDVINCLPGPGAYGIPHLALEAKQRQRFGTKGMLENGGDGIRTLPTWGSLLGPGTYSFEDTIDQMLSRTTSLRGPYDVFTPDRGKPILTGHFATLHCHDLGPGQYEFKSNIEDMKSRHKQKHGLFGRQVKYPRRPHDRIVAYTLALCPRDPTEPGPGHYDPEYDRRLTHGKNLPGFLSSSQRSDRMATQFFTGNYNFIGPGRYDMHDYNCAADANKHQSNFKSRSDRPQGERLKFLQERIRMMNVPLNRRKVLVEPDEPKQCFDSPSKIAEQHGNRLSDMARRGSTTDDVPIC